MSDSNKHSYKKNINIMKFILKKVVTGSIFLSAFYAFQDVSYVGVSLKWFLFISFGGLFLMEAFQSISLSIDIFNGKEYDEEDDIHDKKSISFYVLDKVVESSMIFSSLIIIAMTYSISKGLNIDELTTLRFEWLSWLSYSYLFYIAILMIAPIKNLITGIQSTSNLEKLKKDILDNMGIDLSTLKDSSDVYDHLRGEYGDNIFAFDCECIEDDDSYVGFLDQYCEISNNALPVKNIVSNIDRASNEAFIKAEIGSKTIDWTFTQDSDWFSHEFHENMKKISKKITSGEFFCFPSDDQCLEVIYLERNEAKYYKKHGYLL